MSNSYGEIFELELDCWCAGLERVQEPIDRSVLHQVIKEFSPVLREAIEHSYVCDIVATANQLVTSAKLKSIEKEIAFYILAQLPSPAELTHTQSVILEQIVDTVEQKYGGARKRLEKKWSGAQVPGWQGAAQSSSQIDGLAFPPKSLLDS